MQYRADIDGLRAVAVLAVIAYHAQVPGFTGGFVGVDVFFVISGFLITGLVRQDILGSSFTLAAFYVRRARRLLPALFCVLLFSFVVATWLYLPSDLENVAESVAAAALFSSNFLFFSESGYFEGAAEIKPLLHTWSLAIEEQFYLFFPPILVWLFGLNRQRVAPALVAIALASFAISVWSMYRALDAGFFLPFSRIWELLLGALICIWWPTISTYLEPRKAIANLLSLAGALMLAGAVTMLDEYTPHPGIQALLPCMATGLLVMSAASVTPSVISRLLSRKPLVFIGLMSYSLYLWHWPLLVFAKYYLARPLLGIEVATILMVTLGVSYGSWRFVERPFRRHHGGLNTRAYVRLCILCFVPLIVASVVFDHLDGVPQRFDEKVLALANFGDETNKNWRRCIKTNGTIQAEQLLAGRYHCRFGNTTDEPEILVWGDSHAASMLDQLDTIARKSNRSGVFVGRPGCPPLMDLVTNFTSAEGDCGRIDQAVNRVLEGNTSIRTVVLAARWAIYAEGVSLGFVRDKPLLLRSSYQHAKKPADNELIFSDAMTRTVRHFSQAGYELIVVGPIPEPGFHVPRTLALAEQLERKTPTLELQNFFYRQRHVLPLFNRLAEMFPMTLAMPHTDLCDKTQCRVSEGDLIYYRDDDHLSPEGAMQLNTLHVISSPLSQESRAQN